MKNVKPLGILSYDDQQHFIKELLVRLQSLL